MNDEQIKHMVDRFLCWPLPDDFSPDGGISYTPTFNTGTPYEGKNNPTGTSLLDATQAEKLIRYLVKDIPASHN